MLLLFDIDLTLIETAGAGSSSLIAAGKRVFGKPDFHDSGVQYAGRLDSLIIPDMLIANGIEPSVANIGMLGEAYVVEIERALEKPAVRAACKVLPGVRPLLHALQQESGFVLGLLTGNYERSGRAKLLACGLDADDFSVRVWAGCAPRHPARREDLPGVALARAGLARGSESVIIGDTIHDARAAREHGCWCLGVLTGSAKADELRANGAHAVFANLGDTPRVLRTLRRWKEAGAPTRV
jgi:phosphoglycolate phosphatase-like HAD superfamily hydrolase